MLKRVYASKGPRILHLECPRHGLHTAARPVKSIAALVNTSELDQSQEIRVNGFVNSLRRQKKVVFATIRDGTTLTPIQALLDPTKAAE